MKKILFLLLITAILANASIAQVKIGAAGAPVASAVLELSSADKGLLIPQLSFVSRNLIASPATGLMIYQSDNTPGFYYYNGNAWVTIAAAGDLVLPFTKSQSSPASALFNLTNTSTTGTEGAIQGASSSTEGSATAIKGTIVSTNPGGFSTAVRGINNGTSGLGVGMYGSHAGSGWGVYGVTPTGLGVYGNSSGIGTGVYANSNSGTGLYATSSNGVAANFIIGNIGNNSTVLTASTSGTGSVGSFANLNADNNAEALIVTSVGDGGAGSFKVDRTTGTSAAVKGEVNSIFGNFGTAGIYGISSGTGGFAGLFHATNPAGLGPSLHVTTDGNGNGIFASAKKNGHGIEVTCNGTGNAIFGWVPNFGTGKAAYFANYNAANGQPAVHILHEGTGTGLLVNQSGVSGNIAIFQSESMNLARINKAGRGFFNGGTQTGGADLAEIFDVEGNITQYEKGDVLVISTNKDRMVERSSIPYSTLVAGVYATKPGVLLTEEHIDTDISDKVPMGVIGVIPTKVCTEGGEIKRGDLLVTSSIPGVAMKADINKVKPGQIIGKALQEYDGNGVVKIKVLVNVK